MSIFPLKTPLIWMESLSPVPHTISYSFPHSSFFLTFVDASDTPRVVVERALAFRKNLRDYYREVLHEDTLSLPPPPHDPHRIPGAGEDRNDRFSCLCRWCRLRTAATGLSALRDAQSLALPGSKG